MVDFLASKGTDLGGGDFGHGDGPSVIGGEFDQLIAAAFIDLNDRSDITRGKPVFGEVGGQRHTIQLFVHTGRGYAVMERGVSLPVFQEPNRPKARLTQPQNPPRPSW